MTKSNAFAAGLLSAVLLVVAPLGARAAEGANLSLQVRQLAPNVYWVEGGGGNAGFVVGEQGVVVIDAKISADGARAMLAEIAKVTPRPVSAVVLTHGDIDHVGGLAAFPPGVTVVAHEAMKARAAAAVAAGRSRIPADRLPNRTVSRSETVELAGVRLGLLHWAPAHTDGDLVVYLPREKIVFTGDIFALDQPRALIHSQQNGSSEGWVETARGIVALDADRFVVGHGDVQGKAALQRRVDESAQERVQVRALVAQGKTLAEIQAAVGDPPPGGAPPAAGGPRFEAFSQVIFEEATANK